MGYNYSKTFQLLMAIFLSRNKSRALLTCQNKIIRNREQMTRIFLSNVGGRLMKSGEME